MLKQRKQDFPLNLSKKLNIAHINVCTEAEGPYKRMAIWFQGCNILCRGCCNPELQEIKVAHILTVQETLDIALKSKKENKIEGVTFLGGEPTMQEGLVHLASALALNGLGTILFTGMTYDSLKKSVRNAMDLIVDGRFEMNQIDKVRNLVGSKNQELIYVTDRYRDMSDWFLNTREKRIEINFSDALFVNGDII